MKFIIIFYRFLAKYKWEMVWLLTVLTGAVTLETIRPYWLKGILDSAGKNDYQMTGNFLILFGISTLVGNLVSAYSYYLSDKILIPLMREIRETIFRKVMDLDFAYHVDKNTGSLISAFKRGDQAVWGLFANLHQELFRVLVGLIITLYLLMLVSWEMAAMLMALFVVNMIFIWYLIKINLSVRKRFNEAEDEVSSVITDSMINYETVKFFAAENKEEKRLSDKFDIWAQKFWAFGQSFRLMDIGIGSVSGGGILLILGLGVRRLGQGMGIGDFVMVSGLVTGFYYQFFNLFFRVREIAKSMTDIEKYFGILGQETQVKDPEFPIKPNKTEGKIELKNVGFVYPKNKERVLDGISLMIKPGEKVAFVGRSGSGKTTLTKLLLRFYDVSEGIIELDGVDIKAMKKADLRSHIGVVPQEPIMFNNTIKFNLAYGKDKAKWSEIKEAARKANILEFIEKLDKKWETKVGERGIKLSGGQKQRLAIARALLSDPKVLIFDEATSNLDSESERKIQEALKEVSHSRTVIIIAHRLSTVRDADKIIVLSNGIIAETGKHESLIKQDGIYKRLWTLQSKGKLVGEEVAAI